MRSMSRTQFAGVATAGLATAGLTPERRRARRARVFEGCSKARLAEQRLGHVAHDPVPTEGTR